MPTTNLLRTKNLGNDVLWRLRLLRWQWHACMAWHGMPWDGMGWDGMGWMGWWNPKDVSTQAINRRQQMMGTCMGMQQQMMQHNGSWMRGR
ncbi:hypothetical protein [Achromobacter ruhlandii]|uniref:hypothetical protein n=1 Tax=Achromobacter ruhlandii TaxID=72557 RepID=UPI00158175D8|nr:hypothetical protein [Achromobacter ruhlandii]